MFSVKCRNLPLRVSLIFSIITVASFLFSRKYFEEEFVSVDNPLPLDLNACGNFPFIGNSLCQAFSKGLVRIKKSEEPRKDGAWTVFRGILKDKNHALRYKNCSIRVFGAEKGFPEASNDSFSLFKRLVCQSFGKVPDCDPQVTLQNWKLLQNVISSTGILDVKLVQGLSLPLTCPSQRFVNRIVRRSASEKNGFITLHNLKDFEKASLLLRLKIAPKMWMNEAFPSNEGWPFGISYGACGRIVLNKDEGSVTLAALYNEPWKKRVDMAVQLLEIAMQLTQNSDGYVFSFRHLQTGDFIRNSYGKIRIAAIDKLEVIDKDEIYKMREQTHGHKYASCQNYKKDHNIQFACGVLVSTEERSGFLHHPQESEKFTNSLKEQLYKCSRRSEGIDYFGVAESIKRMLDNVRPCSDDIPYRFPECEYMHQSWQPGSTGLL